MINKNEGCRCHGVLKRGVGEVISSVSYKKGTWFESLLWWCQAGHIVTIAPMPNKNSLEPYSLYSTRATVKPNLRERLYQ